MEDIPPCSRLYISLGSGFNPTNLRELLESYGRVGEFKAPRKTNAKGQVRQRGFAFVKFFKTSDAAAALEGLDGTEFENLTLKVSVAGTQRSEAGNIVNIIPRLISFTLPEAQELDQVEEMLSRFGTVKEVYFYNKSNTRVNARFDKFSEAANCVEQLVEYSAYLVVPKNKPECGIKRAFEDVNPYEHYNTDMNAVGSEPYMMMYQNPSMYQNPMMMNLNPSTRTNGIHIPDTLAQHSVRTNLRVAYNPVLSVDQVSRLFDIIPGFLGLQLQEVGSNGALGLVSYSSTEYAQHALTKLQGLEYPLKSFFHLELIPLDKTSISDPIPDLEPEPEPEPEPAPAPPQVYDVASAVDAGIVCSVDLPPPEPLVDQNSEVVTSIFFVIKQLAGSPTQQLVENLFSRFGNLVEARCMRGKSCGFAKFSSDESAHKCLNTLKDSSLLGCALRVEIADPSRFNGEKTFRR